MRPAHARFVVQTTLVYATVAALWIAFSDWILDSLVHDRRLHTELSVAKGWAFVGVTALLLYGLLRRGMHNLQREADAKAKSQQEMRQWADAFTHCAHGLAIAVPGKEEVLACNSAFAQLLGRTVGSTVGSPILSLYSADDHAHVRRSIAEADRAGSVQYEARMLRADQSTIPVQMDVVSVRGPGDGILYRVATAQDISARKAAETTLRQSEEQLRSIIENLTEGLLITDLEGRPLLWNRAFLTGQNLAVTEETRRELGDFRARLELTTLDGRVLSMADRPLERVLRGEVLRDMRCHVRPLDQTEARVFSFHGEIIHDSAGRSLVLLANMDVTERTRAVEALRESEQRFRAVVENIHEVFWIRDPASGRLLYISPAFETIWGRKPEELLAGSLETMLGTVHPDDQERIRAIMTKPEARDRFDEQYRIVRPDGAIRWVRDQAFPVLDGAHRVMRIVGVAQDMTERKQLEAQFLRAQRVEAVGTLAGGIAHDLNNILAPMLMAAGLLKERIADAGDREMLGMLERSARRGADIIRQLLTFSRGVDGARLALQPRHIVKEIGGIVRETFPRDIVFVENVAADLWAVVADATQLHQVLVNLCVNARDAMPDGGTLTIAARNRELSLDDPQLTAGAVPGRYVLLSVIDTGSGMAPEIVERIFDPFFTTKEPGKGTGLGLSTVLGIVRSHAGFISVCSEPGRGSSFHVFLPAAPAEAHDETPGPAEPLPTGRGELILVVDDEEAIREATRQVLERQNYRVLTAMDGKDALTTFLAQRDRIRLVLTDVMMPQMGGAALVRALLLLHPTLKIIATSGLEQGGRRDDLLAAGAIEVLPKPCGPKPLLDSIRRALDAGPN